MLAKKATLSGKCHDSIVSHRPTCLSTSIIFGTVPCRGKIR